MRRSLQISALALGTVLGVYALEPIVSAQQPATHEHAPPQTAREIYEARSRLSPELQRIKALAGRWDGTTHREREGTTPAVVTYAVTAAGSAVIETLFPGTAMEMTTVYHDDSSGRLIAQHYCNAANQPKLRLVESGTDRLLFVLAPEADIKADVEHHAHELTLTFGADGSLTHDWLNHAFGRPAQRRNIQLTKTK